jgi:hypothetical protein
MRIGTDLLPVPATAADQAGAAPRLNPAGAEAATHLALMRGRRPGRSQDGSGCGFGAARTPGREARLGTIGDRYLARRRRCTATSVSNRRRAPRIARFVENS